MLHMRFAAEETINKNHAIPKNILIRVEFGWSFSVRRPVIAGSGRPLHMLFTELMRQY